MRLCRFTSLAHADPAHALLEGDALKVLSRDFLARPDDVQSLLTGEEVALASARLLAPVMSSKVVGIGLNYRAHAAEMNKPIPKEPRIFLKPSTSIIGPQETIMLPPSSQRVDHEGELAVVIGRTARNVRRTEALGCVLGYTCCNDVTARDLQQEDVQYTRAKGFDTFCPMGPWIETSIRPDALRVTTRVDAAVRQDGNTSDMITDVADLIVFVSSVMTLLPGDVISTGTPPGVGPLRAGNKVEVEIEGIGVLVNDVRA